jgi:hypothetical protein
VLRNTDLHIHSHSFESRCLFRISERSRHRCSLTWHFPEENVGKPWLADPVAFEPVLSLDLVLLL